MPLRSAILPRGVEIHPNSPIVQREGDTSDSDIINHRQAAKRIGVAPSTLYNMKDVPRLRHNKYSRVDLDRYMATKPKKSKPKK